MFELHDSIAALPGLTAARELLVRRALEYLQTLARESGSNEDLQREVAIGYERVAVVQGYLAESNLGNVKAALESFQKSYEILGNLTRRRPSDHPLSHDYQRVSHELATAYAQNGKFPLAEETARASVTMAEASVKAAPNDLIAISDLSAAYGELADVFTN